jgi:proteasome alpha subunit
MVRRTTTTPPPEDLEENIVDIDVTDEMRGSFLEYAYSVIYHRITFDGAVTDEHHYLVMGSQADQVATLLKERYTENMTLAGAMAVAIAALSGQANGDRTEITGAQLEVAILERFRSHRKFRRLTGARLETLLAEVRSADEAPADASPADETRRSDARERRP